MTEKNTPIDDFAKRIERQISLNKKVIVQVEQKNARRNYVRASNPALRNQ